jgi:purine nucleosidase
MRIHGLARATICFVLVLLSSNLALLGDTPRIKIIIDADPAIGVRFKDVDDGLMLLVALNSPELEILGITTIYGNASQDVSYEKARELVDLSERQDVPVFRGAEKGDTVGTATEASEFIIRMAEKYPGEVTVLAVGPMTNVATAISASPTLAHNLKNVISMGGNVSAANVASTQCWSDLNYGSDKEAAGLFLETVADLTVVSIQTSERFYISRTRYRRLIAESEYSDYLERNTRFWYWIRRRVFVVWDLVALACVVHPEWFETNHVSIDYYTTITGEPRILETSTSQPIVSVNIPEFQEDQGPLWDWFFSRI